MDPIKLQDLRLLENWSTFTPNMKGFIPPEEVELDEECDNIEDQIREFTHRDFMRNHDAPVMALHTPQEYPAFSIAICDEIFTPPLPRRETKYMSSLMTQNGPTAHTATKDSIQLSGKWNSFVEESCNAVLHKLYASSGRIRRIQTLATLDLFQAGSHRLSTTKGPHYATVIFVLPSFAADVRFYTNHEGHAACISLSGNIAHNVSVFAMYSGLDAAFIDIGEGGEVTCLTYHVTAAYGDTFTVFPSLENISGALSPLLDAFCVWRYRLNTRIPSPKLVLLHLDASPQNVYDFSGGDATLLCHLAPLAKAYGFRLYIGQLTCTFSFRQKVKHPYKEYLESTDDIDLRELKMWDPEVEHEWNELVALDGKRVNGPTLLELATTIVTDDDTFNEKLLNLKGIDEIDIEDDTLYFADVVHREVRHATYLFITPFNLA